MTNGFRLKEYYRPNQAFFCQTAKAESNLLFLFKALLPSIKKFLIKIVSSKTNKFKTLLESYKKIPSITKMLAHAHLFSKRRKKKRHESTLFFFKQQIIINLITFFKALLKKLYLDTKMYVVWPQNAWFGLIFVFLVFWPVFNKLFIKIKFSNSKKFNTQLSLGKEMAFYYLKSLHTCISNKIGRTKYLPPE